VNRQPVTKILSLHIDTQERREEIIRDACLKGYITEWEEYALLLIEKLLSEGKPNANADE